MFERRIVHIDKATPISVLIEMPPASAKPQENKSPIESKLTEHDARIPCFVMGAASHYHDKFSPAFRSFYKLVLIEGYWVDGEQFPRSYTDTLTLDRLSDHIEQIRRQLEGQLGENYRKIFVLGHSAYGFEAAHHASRYPDTLFGFINLATPLVFDQALIGSWQEEYLNSNFGPKAAKWGGPTPRWETYRAQQEEAKSAPQAEEKSTEKEAFVKLYGSRRAVYFANPSFWQKPQADALWNPWQVTIYDSAKNATRQETRDMNMPMVNQYLKLVAGKEYYTKLATISVPGIWVVGQDDVRISLYQLEDPRMPRNTGNVETFISPGGHWPMYSEDVNTAEFDAKLRRWGSTCVTEAFAATEPAPAMR